RSRFRVHGDAAHPRQVDDEAAVTARMPRGAVPTRSNGKLEIVIACKPDRRCNLVGRRRPDDDCRSPVVDGVPEPASLVVAVIFGRNDLGRKRVAQAAELVAGQRRGRLEHWILLWGFGRGLRLSGVGSCARTGAIPISNDATRSSSSAPSPVTFSAPTGD